MCETESLCETVTDVYVHVFLYVKSGVCVYVCTSACLWLSRCVCMWEGMRASLHLCVKQI